MRLILVLAALLTTGLSPTVEARTYHASAAMLQIDFNQATLDALGLQVAGAGPDGRLEARSTSSGVLAFGALPDGPKDGISAMLFNEGPVLHWGRQTVDLRVFRLSPVKDQRETLAITDEQGREWLLIAMGHRQTVAGGRQLELHVADVRPGPALRRLLGLQAEAYLGRAYLTAELMDVAPSKGLTCPVNWPTAPDADADLELLSVNQVVELVTSASRAEGRVVITPSATFRNSGTADLPWYQVFATPGDDGIDEPTDDDDCLDDGSGRCQPYGNDQGGLLIWNFYRFEAGRLHQIGRSGVKHAFNSINLNCSCSGGRVAFVGCEDLYSASTNVDQGFLGDRAFIDAFPVRRRTCNSVFDRDCDQVCDDIRASDFVKCHAAPASDEFDRRLWVTESDLGRPGARYFMEAWYLVRDDVDIFNSMGYQEVSPQFNGSLWTFAPVASFVSGPVAASPEFASGFDQQAVDTGEGQLTVLSRVTPVVGGFRYQYAVMNHDFDRQIAMLSIAIHPAALPAALAFVDGDLVPENDWIATVSGPWLSWRAPSGSGLDWGTMYSFEFESALAPRSGRSLRLSVLEPGDSSSLDLTAQGPAPEGLIFFSGFEPEPGD